MGFVFQDFALIPHFSACENITYPLIPRGIACAERIRRATDLMARFGLENKIAVPARELSGGEQQRVAIARALAGNPEVLLADEPTSNLDRESVLTLSTILQQIHAAGTTVLIACHDQRVNATGTQVVEMLGGSVCVA
jgi:putative ABC transport system ATP-binding protein